MSSSDRFVNLLNISAQSGSDTILKLMRRRHNVKRLKDIHRYADERRTHIDMTAVEYIEDESFIPEDMIVVTLTKKGYIKRLSASTYKTQHRGGVGIKGMSTNDEDFVEQILNCSTHDYVLFFTNMGKVYRVKGYKIPEYSRQSKGLPIINFLEFDKNEKISSLVRVNFYSDEYKYLLFVIKNGLVKRKELTEFDIFERVERLQLYLKIMMN